MDFLPTQGELINAIVEVLKENNSILTTKEIDDLVAKKLQIPDKLLEIEALNTNGTEFGYRMRCIRSKMKNKGLLSNISRGEWKYVGEVSET